ncbi:MAG: site-specific integrase [Clostridia bacterium]|nr:site-specific integrase [Clostridia bacterium]
MTFLYMGIRRSELAGLQWKDINFETGTMHVQRSLHFEPRFGKFYKSTKTESSNREITMPDRLLEEYKKYKQWWNENRTYTTKPEYEDAIIKSDSGEAYEPSLFIIWLRKVLKKAGLPAVTLHSIRHTNISLQLMAGVDIKTVAARAGHSMASTTSDIYSHFMRSSDIKASNIIDNIFED